jgi:hypothetical protein
MHKDLSDLARKFGPETARRVLERTKPFPNQEEPTNGAHLTEQSEGTDQPAGRPLTGSNLVDYSDRTINHEDTLLGERYLCRGGGMLLVAPSGQGKSSLTIQSAILLACGRTAFGITPARPMRCLIIQAEDDEGDIIEMARLLKCLRLTQEEKELVAANTHIEFINDATGQKAIEAADQILNQWPADLLWINPLTSYCGCDPKDEGKMLLFLRAQLNPLLSRHRCAVVVVHHTPKTNFRADTSGWKPSDWMYAGAGSATLTNWARAVMVIDPTETAGVFRFIAAKRGARIGWETYERYFAHSKAPGQILWVDATEEEITLSQNASSAVKTVDLDRLLKLVPVLDPIQSDSLEHQASQRLNVGLNKIQAGLRQLACQGKIFKRTIPNPSKGRPFVGWAQTPDAKA